MVLVTSSLNLRYQYKLQRVPCILTHTRARHCAYSHLHSQRFPRDVTAGEREREGGREGEREREREREIERDRANDDCGTHLFPEFWYRERLEVGPRVRPDDRKYSQPRIRICHCPQASRRISRLSISACESKKHPF